jgi:hypothetical protein
MVRGTVTAATGDHLTVKTEAGDTYQVVVTTNTRIMKDRQTVKMAEIHPGDGIGAMGVIDAPTKTVHAAMLMVVDAEQIKKARENMGKTYISGKVLAIDDVTLTIQRPDDVTQKIMVDEGTSFRKGGRRTAMAMRGDPASMGPGDAQGGNGARAGGADAAGESITLADIKVGDMVAGQGALKNGVFVPTQLVVMDASAMRRRRQQETGGASPNAAGSASPAVAAPPNAATTPPSTVPK